MVVAARRGAARRSADSLSHPSSCVCLIVFVLGGAKCVVVAWGGGRGHGGGFSGASGRRMGKRCTHITRAVGWKEEFLVLLLSASFVFGLGAVWTVGCGGGSSSQQRR